MKSIVCPRSQKEISSQSGICIEANGSGKSTEAAIHHAWKLILLPGAHEELLKFVVQ
jgi:hypothetical protein